MTFPALIDSSGKVTQIHVKKCNFLRQDVIFLVLDEERAE